MKPQFTIAFLLLFISSFLFGQQGVEFKVKILADNSSFQVLARPNVTANDVIIVNSQITLRVPLGGFEIGTITNHLGTWNSSTSYEDQGTGFEYFFLTPSGPITGVNLEGGVEFPLFTFENAGTCTGPMELIDNENDPVVNSPNPPPIILTNSMNITTIGPDAYLGNYSAISADCNMTQTCGTEYLDILDIIPTPPSTCFATDGSLEIDAITSGPPLQYGLKINSDPIIWQTTPVFAGLRAGDIFSLRIRHIGGACLYQLDDRQLEGPFKPIIDIANTTNTPPDCGMDNGTITIAAYSVQGNDLEYAAGNPPVYQSSNTIEDLSAGLISLWARDVTTGCTSNVPGYLLEDCMNVPCSNLDLENMGNGLYQVSLTAGETINAPNNTTESLRVTLKVPTGGFDVTNLVSQVTNVDFAMGTITVAPAASPGFDYISILLDTPNTTDIPYFQATKIPLFTFENGGTCEGDSIYLIPMDDPYLMTGADVNHEFVLAGATTINDCIGEGAVACETIPSSCDVTYEIDRLPSGEYRISVMTDNESFSGLNAFTSGMLVAFKVPAGGFEISNLTTLVGGSFSSSLIIAQPAEDPMFDYYNIYQEPSSLNPDYIAGQFIPFITFENVGPCVSGDITLIDNDDPVANAVAAGNNINFDQSISIVGFGSTVLACLSSNASVECQGDPCQSLSPGFQVGLACEGASIDFTNTTTSNEAIASWEWTFGDGSPTSDIESPSHTFSNSGNFEVSLTVTTDSGCEATYSEFVTVFPSPGVPAITEYTDCGSGVEITVPSASNITWSPEDGLQPAPPTNQSTVTAHPMATTVYTVTLTTDDGCSTETDITVVADSKPDWKNVNPLPITDCGLQDGSIHATATALGDVEYSLDPNGPWTLDSIFTGLAAGQYNVFVRNAGGNCPVASPFNPVTITEPAPFTLGSPDVTNPTACTANGSITVNATGGEIPLQYTLVGVAGPQDSNVFNNLPEGDYTIEVTNFDGSCLQTTTASLVDTGGEPIVTSRNFESEICADAMGNVSIALDQAIQDVNISGGAFANQTINGNVLNFDVDPDLGVNDYTIEFRTVNGCSLTDVISITGTAAPTVSFSSSPTLCVDGDITFNFTGTAGAGATYQWSADGGGDIFFDDGNGVAQITWAAAGSFDVTLTVIENGCEISTSNSMDITDFDPGLTLIGTNPSCGVGGDGAIDLNVNGSGYNFNWSGPGVVPGIEDQNDLPGGTYLVTITDTNSGCEATDNITLDVPTGISISSTSTPVPDCIGGAADGTVTTTISGGNGNFTFEIFDLDDLNNALETISVGNSSYTFNNLNAGAYSVAVTDANGCTDVETVAIQSTNSGVTTSTSFTNADCTGQNGSLSVTVESGDDPYTYQYFSNNTLINSGDVNGSTLDIGGVASGSATVMIIDANGCMDVASFVIGENDPDWLSDISSTVTEPSCSSDNGSIELQGLPSGAFVSWIDCPTCSDPTLPDIGEGIYDVSILDASGCQADLQIQVNSTDGPAIEILAENAATCGNADGGLIFQVSSGNSFEYRIIGTEVITGQGSPDQPIAINNLEADNWIIEVTDLVNSDCGNFAVAEIAGGFDVGDLDTYTTLPSECGVHDATIEINVDFPNMLNLTTDKGNAPAQFMSNVTVTDLYDGDVTISMTDPLTNCTEEIIIDLGEQPEPEINIGDFELTHLTCPTDFGSINSNVAYEFFIEDAGGNVKLTPWNDAPKGTYKLRLEDGECFDTMDVTIDGPDPWDVTPTVEDETCDGEDGTISLLVSGGTPDYKLEWSNNVSTSLSAENLSAGDYEVTITDDLGCTFVVSEFVDAMDPFQCDCDHIFYNDTIYQSVAGNFTKICLPTDLSIPDFGTYNLVLDGIQTNNNIDECSEMIIYYPYSIIFTNDPPPYQVDEWISPSGDLAGFQFETLDELVAKMKEEDPTGNWVNDKDLKRITGGDPNRVYGHMNITAVLTSSSGSMAPDPYVSNTPSITVNDDRTHVLIASDPLNPDCSDTLYINLLEDGIPISDTLTIEIEVGEVIDTCLDISQLNGVPESLTNDCVSPTNNALWLASGTECFELEGVNEGTEELCLVLCDDNGLCDTTHVIVDVTGDGELFIYNGFSPNNDNKNDYFKIKNIEKYPNNHIAIYNRWGNRIYKKDTYTNSDPWRGNYNQQILPDGSYFYMLEVEIDGKMEMKKGYVQIRR